MPIMEPNTKRLHTMTNPNQLYKVLPGGQTAKKVNPFHNYKHECQKQQLKCSDHDKCICKMADYFNETNPPIALTKPMEEGAEFSGVEVWQIKTTQRWSIITAEETELYRNSNAETRKAIKPIQPVKGEKEVPKEYEQTDEGEVIGYITFEYGDLKMNNLDDNNLQAVDANKEQNVDDVVRKLSKKKYGPGCMNDETDYREGLKVGIEWQQSQSIEIKDEVDLEINRLQWFEEEVESIHKWLDEQDAPTHNDNNKLSVVGRFTKLQSKPSIESIVGFVLEWVAERTGAMYPYNDQDTKQNILNTKADIIKELKK
jgi:hypothetical protein